MADNTMVERVAAQICSLMPGTCYEGLGGGECVCVKTARAIEALRASGSLEPEDRQKLQTAMVALVEIVRGTVGIDEEYFRKLLLSHGFSVVPAEKPTQH